MGALSRHRSPTGVHPVHIPKTTRVGFAGVTGISRPPTNDEHWALYYFEAHAGPCHSCFDSLNVSRSGKKLCDQGHRLAVQVASHVFRRSDGEVYSRTRDGAQEVRVEVPLGYDQTLALLKAIQRGVRQSESVVKPVSHDPAYLVAPRTFSAEAVKIIRNENVKPIQRSTKAYDTIVVEPSSSTRRPMRETHDSPLHSKRGSLYDLDMGELARVEKREQKLRYNLQVREPAAHNHRRIAAYH